MGLHSTASGAGSATASDRSGFLCHRLSLSATLSKSSYWNCTYNAVFRRKTDSFRLAFGIF